MLIMWFSSFLHFFVGRTVIECHKFRLLDEFWVSYWKICFFINFFYLIGRSIFYTVSIRLLICRQNPKRIFEKLTKFEELSDFKKIVCYIVYVFLLSTLPTIIWLPIAWSQGMGESICGVPG